MADISRPPEIGQNDLIAFVEPLLLLRCSGKAERPANMQPSPLPLDFSLAAI